MWVWRILWDGFGPHAKVGKRLSYVFTCVYKSIMFLNSNPVNARPIALPCLMQQEGKPREARSRAQRGEDTASVLYTIINLSPSGKATRYFLSFFSHPSLTTAFS